MTRKKKRSVYSPRRGLRFANGRKGGPAAGFVAATAITPVVISADVEQSLKQIESDVGDVISGSVSYGRVRQSLLYNRSLLGSSISSTGRPYSTVITPITGNIPSWTNKGVYGPSEPGQVGPDTVFSQAFVNRMLGASSSLEAKTLNYYVSGTEALESSPVPASGTLFFSKKQRYQTLIVKKTASFFDTVFVPGEYTPVTFAAGTGTLISTVTGTIGLDIPTDAPLNLNPTGQLQSYIWAPACITIDVPQAGRIVDLKVWIELVHLSGAMGADPPLANLGIALRSPNVSFGHAHPIRNSPELQRVYTSNTNDYSFLAAFGATAGKKFFLSPPHRFWRDTFILWEGPSVFGYGSASPNAEYLSRYPTFGYDRSMRTVFSDGAPVPNPRHIVSTTNALNYNGSPNLGAFGVGTVFGNNAPWTSDRTVFPATESLQAVGSPPAGWLTGPAATPLVNEWPTTGVNYGTNTIRPLYPLLDAVIQKKVVTSEFTAHSSSNSQGLFLPDSWVGVRPGLRGTEMQGQWKLLISSGMNATYFRQVRLEFTYEPSTRPPAGTRSNNGYPAYRAAPRLFSRISGSDVLAGFSGGGGGGLGPSASWDCWVNEQYDGVSTLNEIGRSFGVRLNTGSFDPMQFALIYNLTGSIADASGSAPGWLLNNQFGMPSIPDASASLAPYVAYVTPEALQVQTAITPNKTLDGPRRLADVAADLNPLQTLAERATAFVSSSAT